MKWVVTTLLVVFLVFLSAPTIVSLIEKSTDTSCFYDASEEDLSTKEIKSEFKFDHSFELAVFPAPISKPVFTENYSKHDNVAATIFIPPPELA